jgi:transposase-like protein
MALTHSLCLQYLEKLRWNGKPSCPYCGTKRSTPIRNENRHHCGYCYTSYSVTVGTIFHHSHILLDKWFKAIFLLNADRTDISVRLLAQEISVTNRTASSIIKRIIQAKQDNPEMLNKIKAFYVEHTRSD